MVHAVAMPKGNTILVIFNNPLTKIGAVKYFGRVVSIQSNEDD